MRHRLAARWRLAALLALTLCAGTAAQAVDVTMMFGQSLAPFANERDGRGIEIDIIRAALAAAGHRLKPRFLPQARLPVAWQAHEGDAAATLTPDSGLAAAYSEVYIQYEDVVIAQRGRFRPDLKVADLAGLRVVGFQNAARYLGPDYAAMVRANKRYREQANQLSQLRMLFGGQADVIVAERHIFEYQLGQLAESRFPERAFAVDTFRLFDKIPYRVAFRDKALRDDFDKGVALIRKNGQLASITARYIPYGINP
ncbi:hypothetical protein BH11PSE10_BH11PSE10_15270 [soil metagenome]